MITFKGGAIESMHAVLRELDDAAAESDGPRRKALFREAMLDIINLAVAIARGEQLPDEELTTYRGRVVELLDMDLNRGSLGGFLSRGSSYATRALQPGAYYQAALVRTAAQILLDDYPGMAERFDQHDHDDLNDIDEALREAAEEVPPLPEEAIPEGMPDSHWWWRAPHGDPEVYALLHGSGDEDV